MLLHTRETKERHDAKLPRTRLDIDDIISLLNFILSNNFFIFNGSTYKQVHGCAMRSLVSAIVASLCMEVIEEQAIRNATTPAPKLWKRYVDDSFSILKRTAVDAFHHTLNSIDPHINFTIKHEENGQIAFLDSLVSRKNGTIAIDVYRKPTHTDRYLDYSSHHDKQHKISATRTLIHRSSLLPNSEEGKVREFNHFTKALISNGYPKRVISEI